MHFTRSDHNFQPEDLPEPGRTPFIECPHLAQRYHIQQLFMKDESVNPSGSFKDRAIVMQLKHAQGSHFVISSSGNAAISASFYCKKFQYALDIFVSDSIPSYKRERLQKVMNDTPTIHIHFSKKPKQEAFMLSKQKGYQNLQQSKDQYARQGYATLGQELIHEMPIITDGIFIPTSSGTGLLGIGDGLGWKYPLFAIQTAKIHPIAAYFDTHIPQATRSLASAIVAHVIPQKAEIIRRIKETHGGALSISDEELKNALQDMKETEGMDISYDSALAVAGLRKALLKGFSISCAVCILTGK